MALDILDGVTFQISKLLELVFEGIEYRVAKKARARMAKQRRKAVRASRLGPYEFHDEPPQRQSSA